MLKRTLPVLLALLILAFPLTAFAADGDVQQQTGTQKANQEVPVTVITADGSSGTGGVGVVGRLYYPLEIKMMEEDGEKLLIKTFEVPAGVNPQLLVEDGLVKNDIKYEAREILKQQLPGSEETKLASTSVSVQTKSNDPAELAKLLNPIMEYNEGGFTGQLQLSLDNVYSEADGYRSYQYPVTEVREVSVPERNDTAFIPKTASKNGVQLSLTNVDWTTMGCGASRNGQIVPNTFTARAEYVGYATGSAATGYTVTANYIGEVKKPVEGNAIYSIIYVAKGSALPVLPELTAEKELGAMPYVIIAIVLVLGAIVTMIVLTVRRRGPIPAEGIAEPEAPPRKKIFMPRSMEPDGDGDE